MTPEPPRLDGTADESALALNVLLQKYGATHNRIKRLEMLTDVSYMRKNLLLPGAQIFEFPSDPPDWTDDLSAC